MVKTHKVAVCPSKVTYVTKHSETLLDAALAANIPLGHSCKNGDCGICSAVLLKGLVKDEAGELISSGEFLTCQCKPETDIEIEAEYYPELADIQNKTIPVKVDSFKVLEDVLQIHFRVPPTQKMKYLAGQYINLSYKGVVRAYSIANACGESGEIELHVKKVPNGKMSDLLFNGMRQGMLMHMNGPCGTFFVRDSSAPIIIMVTGTGFAPAKAIIEALIQQQDTRKIFLFWGARYQRGFYNSQPQEWARQLKNFTYIPVLSRPGEGWVGKAGYVQSAVLDAVENLARYQVYACGSPQMIDRAKTLLVEKGLDEKNFYSDAFTAAKDV